MENQLIILKEYCIHYKVEPSFVEELEELGLIRTIKREKEKYIPFEVLPELESFSRMFYELQINMEGIDAIHHLLNRIRTLREEMMELQNRLRFYEL